MAIIGDGRGGIYCENSLQKSTEWKSAAKDKVTDASFDVVITNPPFGAKITISDTTILRDYDLGYKWKKDKSGQWVKTQKLLKKQAPQILFIERCLKFLKPGGKLAIVLPDGILGGAKIGYVPNFIKANFEVIASVDCPIEAFSPNTTTKVHLLILKRRTSKAAIKKTFMSVPEVIGHDRKGHPVYSDPKNQILRDDLQNTIGNWKDFHGGKLRSTSMGFSVDVTELEESLNAKRYLPSFMEILRRVKASSWRKETVGDIYQKLSTGANVDNLDYTIEPKDGIPYVLVKNILDEGITFSNLKYVKKAIAKQFPGAILQEGDIVINRCGDAGIAAIVSKDLAGALLCGFCFLLRVKSAYNPNYVAAFLNSELGRKQLKRLALGSILEHITKEELKTVVVLFPPKPALEKEIAEAFKQATDYRVKARQQMVAVAENFVRNAV
jgi:type I restriction enzyme M protein